MEVSIHELLAAAREAVKSDYIKGESILCETQISSGYPLHGRNRDVKNR